MIVPWQTLCFAVMDKVQIDGYNVLVTDTPSLINAAIYAFDLKTAFHVWTGVRNELERHPPFWLVFKTDEAAIEFALRYIMDEEWSK